MSSAPASRGGQLALDLALEPDYRAASFAVSEANAAALALVNRWPRWRQGHLLLVGPAASGKTHLAHMWRERTRARRLLCFRCVYLRSWCAGAPLVLRRVPIRTKRTTVIN